LPGPHPSFSYITYRAMYLPIRISCATILFVLGTTCCFSEETDTVFLKSGKAYIGRIVEYIPEQDLVIRILDNEALVVPWMDILRVGRASKPGTIQEPATDPLTRSLLDTTEMPPFMISGAAYVNVFYNTGYSTLIDPDVKAMTGWGRGLNGVVAARTGRAKYFGVTVDYLWASFQNGLGQDGSAWTGTGTFWSIGPSVSFEAARTWFTASVSYLHQQFRWKHARGVPTVYLPDEIHDGIRLQGNLIVPVTDVVGIHGGMRVDVAGAIQYNLMAGVSICNFMDILYLNWR